MVKTELVAADIANGKLLVEALDKQQVDLRSAFWFYEPDATEWRLVLAMPVVDQWGPDRGYKIAQKTLARLGLDIPLRRITVVGSTDDLPRLIRTAVRTPPQGTAGIRFTENVVNNVLVEDAYIYRST